ncbi:MAG: hypothetical protein WCP08_02520 [Prolixibacteraceae bacterium]
MAKKTLFWSITLFLILIVVYIMTTTVIMPVVTRNPILDTTISKVKDKVEKSAKKPEKLEIQDKKSAKGEKVSKKSDPKDQAQVIDEKVITGSQGDQLTLFESKKTEYLLRSRYNLACEDSMYLVLDLVEKIACIELKGVPLHKSKIFDFTVSNSISLFHTEQLLHWIGQPFILKNAISTIARVPIAVVNAPKDTIEANSNTVLPSAPVREDVYLILNFDRNLQLIIQQEELSEGKSRIDSLKQSYKKKEIDKTISSLMTFKRELVLPQIVITLKKSDATILFRALPLKPKMVIRM